MSIHCMLLHLNFNFTRTVCCCSLGCNGSGSDWIVSLVDPYKVPQAQTEMDGFQAGCNFCPWLVHPLQSLLKHCGSWSDKFEFSYVHWMWCVFLVLGHSRARSGPELFLKDAINWSYFKLICQVIEPTDQRFNIEEGKGNNLSLRIVATNSRYGAH